MVIKTAGGAALKEENIIKVICNNCKMWEALNTGIISVISNKELN